MKGFYVQLRDAFFLGHLRVAINCHLVTRSDFPEVRLTFLNGRDWDGAKESLLIALNNNIYPCRDRHFIFEMLKWNASLGMGILNGVEEVFLWNLLVAAGDSQSPKAGGDGLVEDSDLRDYLMIVTCLVSLQNSDLQRFVLLCCYPSFRTVCPFWNVRSIARVEFMGTTTVRALVEIVWKVPMDNGDLTAKCATASL